jgi:uncharacterized protein (TIRG00374 family)
MNKKGLLISFALGIAVSVAALYAAFLRVPVEDLLGYLGRVNYWWLIPSALVVVLCFVLRVVRWRLIMGPVARLGYMEAFHPLMMGFAANCLFPGRVGEFIRPAMLKKEKGASFFGVFATVAAERVFDLMVLLILLVVVMANVTIDPALSIRFGSHELSRRTLETLAGGMAKLSGVLLLGMFLVCFAKTREWIERAVLASPALLFFLGRDGKDRLRNRVARPIVGIIGGIAQGFALLQNVPKMAACFGLTAAIWILGGISYWVLAQGTPDVPLNVFEFTAVMVIVAFFIALPSAPGFWGLWEAGGVFAMGLFGVSAKEALGFTLVCHVVHTLPVIVIGLGSGVVKGVSLWQMATTEREGGQGVEGEALSPVPETGRGPLA